MASAPPPNEELAELATVLGDDNVRGLVRTFLRDFPRSLDALSAGDRRNCHRIAHSMKSNARLMGAHQLSQRLAALEAQLDSSAGPDINADDLARISEEFAAIAGPLRTFVGE
jgi:HPt (histidine-containing phosphotransfer) domain-containing protein